jgi:HTH-type transcriptional regulator, competence development regulator
MNTRLGRILTQARQVKGAKLREVEEATKISNAYISQLESGHIKEPSPHKLKTLAEYFGLDYSDLLEAAGYATRRDAGVAEERGVHFMGEALTEDETRAMAAFLRAYRDVNKAPTKK